MMKAVAVSPWCLLGVLYICATVDATSIHPWETAGRPISSSFIPFMLFVFY
uniref:Uncharacterized protein n=1 Tax=Anguilla anguilla TaxID=7936 RepID=A0A0E9SCL0_ANGAN